MNVVSLLAAYNGEVYLPELLSSLSAQTEKDFSVLFQDDGSSDRTPFILSQWAAQDPRFRSGQEQGMHLGPKGNFISLLRQSSADLLMLCDQDDYWEANKVSRLICRYAEATSSLPAETPVLVHSDASIIDAEGHLVAESFFALQGWDPQATGLNRLLVQNNVTGCLTLMNRPLADLVVRYGNPEKMFMHDWFIALTAAAFGSVFFMPEQLVRYRQHSMNTIGASRNSLPLRALSALRNVDKSKSRIALTYSHAQAFLDVFGDALPREAAEIIHAYLQTNDLPKLRRLAAIRKHGYLMQSPVTRMGQYLFG